MNPNWLKPDWPAPAHVHAVVSTRQGGFSQAPFDSLNLGDHVGDDPYAVAKNRHLVGDLLHLPTEPLWLQQVHGIVVSGMNANSCTPQADASVAFKPKQVCVVMTADCLPVFELATFLTVGSGSTICGGCDSALIDSTLLAPLPAGTSTVTACVWSAG